MSHAEVAVERRVGIGLIPAVLVCLAAPALFVLEISWLGWLLLAAGVGGALLIERQRATASDPPSPATSRSSRSACSS
nr:hypothetical protein [Microbacterium sp. NIBRBAC000506063]